MTDSTNKKSYAVIVVGSGINSLVCAALLAQKGKQVLVLERNDRAGGCIRTEELFPGFTHELLSSWYPLFTSGAAYALLKDDLAAQGVEFLENGYTTGVVGSDGKGMALRHDVGDSIQRINTLQAGDGDAFGRLRHTGDRIAAMADDKHGLQIVLLRHLILRRHPSVLEPVDRHRRVGARRAVLRHEARPDSRRLLLEPLEDQSQRCVAVDLDFGAAPTLFSAGGRPLLGGFACLTAGAVYMINQSANAWVDDIAAQFTHAWERLGISYDDFVRTTQARHRPAVEEMIARGKSINVTLIFGLDRYADVIEAYLSGLEAYDGDLSKVASVASFFVSRVDAEVDQRLESIGTPDALDLRGKAAVANAQAAYQLFLEQFSGPRWEALAARGARVQRPLWASTSTKNEAYADTLYVDSLIGPDTVNTMPENTLEAFEDHGTLTRTIDADPKAAADTLAAIRAVGVDLDDVSHVLEEQGVASFAKSFDELMTSLATKAEDLTGRS